ncbi:MAG TPA: hypothetical protein VI231_13200 [Candidatus Binatia bacterium]
MIARIGTGVAGLFELAVALPAFFRQTVTLERAHDGITRALADRDERFLRLVQSRIYRVPQSPYLRLLRIAGCEFSDLETSVRRDGIEATLHKLAVAGVYLDAGEFKGKREVVRGATSFRVSPSEFDPQDRSSGIVTQSTGSSNRPIASIATLERLAIWALYQCIFYDAHGLFLSSHAVYDAAVPAGAGIRTILNRTKAGIPMDKWFAREVPTPDGFVKYSSAMTSFVVVALAKLFGPGAALPETVHHEDLTPIVDWFTRTRAQGRACCLKTSSSNAVRVAQAAARAGISLAGMTFHVGGEPFTESKHAVLQRAGASAVTDYAFEGGGLTGVGCANPAYLDEVHLLHPHMVAIRRPHPIILGDSSVYPLLCTTLHSGYGSLLFNVENGDYGVLESRDCGCALERVGLKFHLHHIRSYEKFTSEGMNYSYGDLYEFVERTLPSEFGGSIGDYQIAEEEDEAGQTRLTLRVDPKLGAIDEGKLLARLRAELGRGAWNNEFQAREWAKAGTLRVRREAPVASARGKILPLEMQKKSAS